MTFAFINFCSLSHFVPSLFQFRNQYDSDVTTWSPQGRLHQVEYAMEAVKQGSATVGLKSQTHAVLVAIKRRPSPLAAYQDKMLKLDDHVGVSFAGLTADAKSLTRWMRNECLTSKYFRKTPLRLSKLTSDLGLKMQLCIQGYNKRPYGVGMLVAGFDGEGPHIVQTCPSANIYPCKAMAIGARSQSARTYLEKFLDQFHGCELEELVKHGLRALRDTLPNEVELNKEVRLTTTLILFMAMLIVSSSSTFFVVMLCEFSCTYYSAERDHRHCGQG